VILWRIQLDQTLRPQEPIGSHDRSKFLNVSGDWAILSSQGLRDFKKYIPFLKMARHS
jgi:hypothetical protein